MHLQSKNQQLLSILISPFSYRTAKGNVNIMVCRKLSHFKCYTCKEGNSTLVFLLGYHDSGASACLFQLKLFMEYNNVGIAIKCQRNSEIRESAKKKTEIVTIKMKYKSKWKLIYDKCMFFVVVFGENGNEINANVEENFNPS